MAQSISSFADELNLFKKFYMTAFSAEQRLTFTDAFDNSNEYRKRSQFFQSHSYLLRICKANAVLRSLHRCVTKLELSNNAKPSVFESVFFPILTYVHQSWVMTDSMLS